MPLSNLTRASLLVEWKLTAKAELNCEIYKSWRKCWKNRDSFSHQSSPVSWIVWHCLGYCRSWKSNLGKFAVAINTRGHSIWVLNERSVSEGGNLCPLWSEILKSLWYSVGGTLQLRYSWLWAVVSDTWFVAVPIRVENTRWKARLCVYFNWF